MIVVAILVVVGLWSVLSPPPPSEWFSDRGSDSKPAQVETPANPLPVDSSVVADDSGPSFDVVRVTRGGTGIIAGRADPGAEVEILVDGQTLGRVQADNRGEWVLIFDTPIKPGGAEISLVSRLGKQNPKQSKDIVVVVVPEQQDTAFAESGEGVIALKVPRDGQGLSTVLQRPAAYTDFGSGLFIDTADYDAAGRATFAGRGAQRAELRLYLDNKYLDLVTVGDDGRWVYAPKDPIAAGDRILRIDQVVAEGKVLLRIEVPFNRAKPLDGSKTSGSIEVLQGNHLWQIARNLYGAGFQYTLIFSANKQQIKDPNLIYPGQVFELPGENLTNADPGQDVDP